MQSERDNSNLGIGSIAVVVSGNGVVASLQEKSQGDKIFVRAVVFEGEFPAELVFEGTIENLNLRHGDEIQYRGELSHNRQKSPVVRVTEQLIHLSRPTPIECAAVVKTWLSPTLAWCETPNFKFIQLFSTPQKPSAFLERNSRILITSPVSGVRVALPVN